MILKTTLTSLALSFTLSQTASAGLIDDIINYADNYDGAFNYASTEIMIGAKKMAGVSVATNRQTSSMKLIVLAVRG
jgi:hypothetical protein